MQRLGPEIRKQFQEGYAQKWPILRAEAETANRLRQRNTQQALEHQQELQTRFRMAEQQFQANYVRAREENHAAI